MYHNVYIFAYVLPSLLPYNETHLIVVFDLSDALSDSVRKYFIEDFCIYVHQRYWPITIFEGSFLAFSVNIILSS
jgi:hypothetical protein